MRCLALLSCVTLGCSSSVIGSLGNDGGTSAAMDAGFDSEANDASDASPKLDASTLCHNTPQAENTERALIVSHPFGPNSTKTGLHEVLKLSSDGKMATTGIIFTLGGASRRNVAFTPDGKVGLVALEDGNIGTFIVETDLKVTVAESSFAGKFYADALIVSPDGSSVWVLDPNTTSNAGALREYAIACDGKLSDTGRKLDTSAMFSGTVANANPFQLLVSAKSVSGSKSGTQVHLLDLSASVPSYVRGGSAFADEDAIPSSLAIVDAHALVADDGLGHGDRIGVVDMATLSRVQEINIKNPSAVVTSPYGNAALAIASDTTSKLYSLGYDKTKPAPFTITELKYTQGKPSLPQLATMVNRGALKGHAFVTETTGVRHIAFDTSGNLTDVAVLSLGAGIPNIVGSIGVQP